MTAATSSQVRSPAASGSALNAATAGVPASSVSPAAAIGTSTGAS